MKMKTFFLLLLVINCTNVIFKEEKRAAITPIWREVDRVPFMYESFPKAIKRGDVIPNLNRLLETSNNDGAMYVIAIILIQSLYNPDKPGLFAKQLVSASKEGNELFDGRLNRTIVLSGIGNSQT